MLHHMHNKMAGIWHIDTLKCQQKQCMVQCQSQLQLQSLWCESFYCDQNYQAWMTSEETVSSMLNGKQTRARRSHTQLFQMSTQNLYQ